VKGVKTLLSFTAFMNLHYGVKEVKKCYTEDLHNQQGDVEGTLKTVCT